uniref:MADF domain-containing protein n=1 Tax=Heliothis virescens TaxID=7102 RepID=A0A2A4J5L3_HELVI
MAGDYQIAQIDTELLIKEVKARPSLYARDADKYGDPTFKKTLWEEVAKAIFADTWKTTDPEDIAEQVDLVQRRWKNLRACFVREVKRQKDPKYIFGVAYKRRKYLYYNELLFLKPEFDANDNDDSKDSSIDLPEKNDADNTIVDVDTNIEEIPIAEAMPVRKDVPNIDKNPPVTETNTSKNDSDSTNFALSLVPLLNMLPTHKRIDAQIMLLTVLKRFYQESNGDENKVKETKRTYGKRKSENTITTVEVKCEAESDGEFK